MIKTITLGSIVVCHLLTGNSITQPDGSKKDEIKKILGQVIEINQKSSLKENIEKKEVIEYKRDVLIVKDKLDEIVYEINKTACMPVRKETDQEEKNRLYPKQEIKEITTKDVIIEEASPVSNIMNKTANSIEKTFVAPQKDINIEKLNQEEITQKPKIEEKIEEKKPESNSKKGILDYLKE